RVLLGSGAREVPGLMLRERLGLRMNGERLVVRDEDSRRSVPPARRLLEADAELGGPFLVPLNGVGREQQVPLRHQIGVDVVVGDGAVLVGAGDAVDSKPALGVVMAE